MKQDNGGPAIPTSLIGFTGAYLAAALAAMVVRGNREFIFYLAVMAVLIPLVLWVHRRARLSDGLLWALSVWGLLHMAGGLVPVPESWPYQRPNAVLYSLWLIPERLKYDQVVHAFGFGATTWCCWQVIRSTMADEHGRPVRPTFGLLTLCVAAGMGFGALNEVIEFIAVLTIPNTNVGGYLNTGWDLVSNLVGSLVAAIAIRWGARDKHRG